MPSLNLDEPGTIEFTAQRALAGRALNRCALSLRSPASRAEFLADEAGYLRRFCLTGEEARPVGERDWTGLLRAGGRCGSPCGRRCRSGWRPSTHSRRSRL